MKVTNKTIVVTAARDNEKMTDKITTASVVAIIAKKLK